MKQLSILWYLIGGHRLPEEDDGPARRTQIGLLATGASVLLAGIYGVAIAGGDPTWMAANAYRMPLVVILAGVFSLPAALLAWRVGGAERPASDLVIGLAAGTFTGTLVLAVLSPLVALYAHTSMWLGPVLALLAALSGTAIGLATTWRAVFLRSGEKAWLKLSVVGPLMVLALVHVLTLSQLIAISDLMPEQTFLDGGLEGMASR